MKLAASTIQYEEYLKQRITLEVPAGSQCYCFRPRDFSVADYQCSVCYKWFHLDCIAFNIGKSLPFLTAYHFMCKQCNSNAEEVFSRKQANFAVMCQTALANLMWQNNGQLYFSKRYSLIPFLEQYWEELTTQPRRSNDSWHPNIHKALTSSDTFKFVDSGNGDLLVCLSNTDLGKMGPSYDRFRALTSQLRTSISKLGVGGQSSQAAGSLLGGGALDVGQIGGGIQVAGANVSSAGEAGDSVTSGYTADTLPWRKRKSPGSVGGGVQLAASNYPGSLSGGPAAALGSSTGGAFTGDAAAGGNATAGGGGGGELATRLPRGGAGSAGTGATGGGLVRSTRRTASSNTLAAGSTALSGAFDEGRAKLNALGFPIDHPLNKEGYRYILVEFDKHASGREKWDECEYTAGKPIPGIFYRVFLSPLVVISLNDRANHLKLHESQLSITGDKGYCMARSTHGVHTGTWYFEATITDQPDGSATRIGWSQVLGNLQAPCGYDKFSYSWRSRQGTVFHDSRGKHFAEDGYQKDDVIGCLIHLPPAPSTPTTGAKATGKSQQQQQPQQTPLRALENKSSVVPQATPKTNDGADKGSVQRVAAVNQLPESYKDRPLIKFRNSYYFEEKDEPVKAEKQLKPLPGSKIVFYRNGECVGTAFTDIYAGAYHPAISIYRAATVAANFGPNFRYPPKYVPEWQPLTDRLLSSAVEQTLADMLYLVEKEGLVDRLIKSYTSNT